MIMSLVPQESQRQRCEKESFSSTFLEKKSKTLQAKQNTSLCSQTRASSPKKDISPPSSPTKSSPSPCLELTQTTIDTLITMKTQKLKEPTKQAKGFVTPVKSNPLLSPRSSSKISEDCEVETMIEGDGDTAQVVSEMDTIEGDVSFNSLVIGYEKSVVATPDSELLSGEEEICCVCEVRIGLVNICAVVVCKSCGNYFNSIGSSSNGEDISCVDGLYCCKFVSLDSGTWCVRCWVDRARKMQLGVGESELFEKEEEVTVAVKGRQQAHGSRSKREEDGWRRRGEEENTKEGPIRKNEDDMQRKGETYEFKKDAFKAKEEGRNSFSAKNLRPKTAEGSISQPRHNTINVDKKFEVGTTPSKIQGLVLDEVTFAETGVSKGASMNRASRDSSLMFTEHDLQVTPVLVTSHEPIIQDKLHVKLHALAGDQSTYTCDPGDSFAKDWAGWLAELDLDRRQGHISELMLSNTNIR